MDSWRAASTALSERIGGRSGRDQAVVEARICDDDSGSLEESCPVCELGRAGVRACSGGCANAGKAVKHAPQV